jgi:hypothetical protein
MWVGGHFVYAKTYRLYAMSRLKNDPGITGDIQLSSDVPPRSPETGIATGIFAGTLSRRLSGTLQATPLRSDNEILGNVVHRNALALEHQNIRIRDTIQLSTREGIFRYFVTTVEIVDPSESGVPDSPGHSELTIITTHSFPSVSAVPQRFIVHARPENEMEN